MGGQGSGRRRKSEAHELATDRKPYERQPEETDPAWQAFVRYRDMAKRSHVKLAQALSKSRALVAGWSRKWRWRDRVVAWDREADDRARAATLKQIASMQRRHVRLAQKMQRLGALELKRMLTDAREKADGAGLTAQDVQKLIDAGAKLERVSRGEAETIERREHTGAGGSRLDMLSGDERLKRIEHLLQRRKR